MKVIAALPCAKKRIRLKKLIEYKNSQQEKVYFYGWNREDNIDKLNEEFYQRDFLLTGGGFVNNKARLMYFLWFFVVLKKCLSFSKDDLIWAMGFESAFPAIIASKIKGFKVIFDDADRFSYLFSKQNIIISGIKYLEYLSSKYSYLHIIPCFERYEFKTKSMRILKNTPDKIDSEESKKILFSSKVLNFRKKYINIIYVNGWLTDTRGMKQIFELSNYDDIGILIAGRIDSNYIQNIVEKENVLYLGEIPSIEALSLYIYSDYVFTYYDPKIKINRFAESNKWGDAIEMKTPILVNKEVMTANFLRENKVCLSYAYNDIYGLYQGILTSDKSKMRINIEKLSNKFGYFDDQLSKIFRDLGNQ